MLIALKINSMRTADMRDIISLCNQHVNIAKITSHLRRAPKEIFLSHAEFFLNKVQAPNARDSIKGIFGISDRIYGNLIKYSSAIMREIIKEIHALSG